MTKQEYLEKACQILRKRVRFSDAGLRLPTTQFPGDDTPAIREATKLYVETWIVPLIDCIESDDFARIREYYGHEQGHKMDLRRMSTYSCDAATGDLYEGPDLVGKLVTVNSGAWCRLIDQANRANRVLELEAQLAELRERMERSGRVAAWAISNRASHKR